MQIGILGPLVVSGDDGADIAVAGARLRRLLTRLALDAGRAVAIGELIDAVWIDDSPNDVSNALQSLVSRVRRALGDAHTVQQAPTGYRLGIAPADVDAGRFAERVASGRRLLRSGDAAAAADALSGALRLWRGTPLADADDAPYVAAPTARWEELRLTAHADLAAAELALGHAEAIIPGLEELVAAHPLREPFVAMLMTALARGGRTADALAAYEALRVRLADLLGADPGPELQAQHLALLRGGVPAAVGDPARRRTNLRAPVSSFIGRESELTRVGELLAANRLITIVGPGGAGKTRLAAQAASPFADRYRDGVWLVELAPVTEESAIAQAILGALGIREAKLLERRGELRAAGSVSDRLLDVLADSDALLVIDNCEHLVGAVAELVETLLAHCPAVRVLATSREPLGLTGEMLVAIPPLGLPPVGANIEQAADYPAVQLLAERGRAARSDFALTAGNVTAVVDIVRRLDGLPLAIELAAARLRVLPVTEIAARLSDRFRLLAGGVRTAVARHRTLRAVVEWSWDLLGADERLLAERLAVFPAGMTATAAAQVCADERLSGTEISEILMSLADKSLLQVVASAGGVRYRMLETIREYGVERLDERDELAAARRRHARFFAELAERLDPLLRTASQLDAMAEFAAEYGNMVAALRYLGDSGEGPAALALVAHLSWYWNITGEASEATMWGQFALAASPEDSPARLRVEAAQLLALISAPLPEPANAWEAVQAELRRVGAGLARIDDGTDPMTTIARMYIGFIIGSDGSLGEDLLRLGLASPDPWMRAMALSMHVYFLENNGDVDDMRVEIDQAYAAFSEIGDRWALVSLLSVRAGLRSMDGDVEGAIADFRQGLAYLEQFGTSEDDIFIHLRLAGLRMRQGRLAEAREHVEAVRRGRPGKPVPMERALLGDAAMVGLLMAEGSVGLATAAADELRRRLPPDIPANRLYGHMITLVGAVCAMSAVLSGDLATARADLLRCHPAAVATFDRPLMAGIAVSVAAYAQALGRAGDGAEILGAAAALRGGEDLDDLWVSRVRDQLVAALGQEGFDVAYAAGRLLDKESAAKRIDPGLLLDDGEASPLYGSARQPHDA